MKVYAHSNYIVRGYTRLTHEAIELHRGEIADVPEQVGLMLVGTHSLEFCAVDDGERAETHVCPYWPQRAGDGLAPEVGIGQPPTYATSDLPAPPVHKQMTARRGKPKGKPKKGPTKFIDKVLRR